jgi:Ca2+-binding RTX toxin-like protein
MRIIRGTIASGVTLAAGDSPVLIGGVVTNDGTTRLSAVYGGAGIGADIRNAGTVGDTATFYGILLMGSGTITNGSPAATHAAIEGSSYGLKLDGTATVTNYGSISSGFAGARLQADGRITNGSATDTTALISGGLGEGLSCGEFSDTGLGTVVNFGTIRSANFVGVDLGGAGGRVTNGSSSDTQSTIAGYGDGIRVISGAGTVINFGTVTATVADGIGILGAYSTPVQITNGSSTSTKALISSTYGINAAAGSVVTNFGTITGIGSGGEALDLRGGTVVNGAANSTAALLQGEFVGVYLTGAGGVTNYGQITGGGVSMLLTGGGTILNGSSSDQTALIGNGIDGIDVSGATAVTVTNFGTIEGVDSSILFGGGADRLIVEPGAKFIGTVDGGAGIDTVTFVSGGTLAVSNFYGFEDFMLTAASTLTLTNANFTDVTGSKITVVGGSGGNTVNAAAVTGSDEVVLIGGAGTDKLTGGSGNDIFEFSAANLAATDTVVGGGGSDTLSMTTAGTINAGGISGVETFRLASTAANTLTLTNANFTGVTGGKITVVGGSEGNTVNAAAVTGSNEVVLIGGAGTDKLTGGSGNDIFEFSAANLAATDTVVGGGGSDTLSMTTAGTINAGGISGVGTFRLASTAANTLTLTNANFTGVTGGKITVVGGSGGNTVNAAAVTGSDEVVLVGGAGNDVLTAEQHATMTGGGGADTFMFLTPGTPAAPDTNVITDFTHGTDKIDFSDAGFSLGLSGASSTPQALLPTLFTSNSTGSFTSAAERFAYDTSTGALFYNAHGNTPGSSSQLVATLTGHPVLAATDLFFTS